MAMSNYQRLPGSKEHRRSHQPIAQMHHSRDFAGDTLMLVASLVKERTKMRHLNPAEHLLEFACCLRTLKRINRRL